MKIKLLLSNQKDEFQGIQLSGEESFEIFKKSPGDSVVVRDRLYTVVAVQISPNQKELIYQLELLVDPNWLVSKRGAIVHRNFKNGQRVKVFQASGPENARYVGECGVVIQEDTPNLPLEKRKIGEFHFTTIVKLRLDNGKEIAVPDTILEKIH